MVQHQGTLYVFGGELSFCNDQETPLWMYDIKVSLDIDFINIFHFTLKWLGWLGLHCKPTRIFSMQQSKNPNWNLLELEKVWKFLIIEMLSGEYLGEVPSPQGRRNSQGPQRTLCSGVSGLYVRVWRLPGPQRLDLRVVGLSSSKSDLALGLPGRTCSWP